MEALGCTMTEQQAEERFSIVDAAFEQLHDAYSASMTNRKRLRGKAETRRRGCTALQIFALEGVSSRAFEMLLQVLSTSQPIGTNQHLDSTSHRLVAPPSQHLAALLILITLYSPL